MTFRRDSKLDTSQVEDLRGRRVGTRGMAVGGGGAVTVIVLLIAMFLGGGQGGDLGGLLDQTYGQGAGPVPSSGITDCQTGVDANTRDDCRIVGYVDSIQAWWTSAFADAGQSYEPSKTRFFDGVIQTGCGQASSQVGPFYCPADRYVYIDLGFFDELKSKYGATGGPLAQAYIIAHEYGHHVQDLLGLLSPGGGGQGADSQSVRTELQADCLAGVWAYHAVDTGYLEPLTDQQIADALDAARAVGDDRIQAKFQGRVNPESWTHGSSTQRQASFTTGWRSGDVNSCDASGG